MPAMSDEFRARGEQWRRLAEYQQARDLEALTAYVDSIIAGQTPAQPSQRAPRDSRLALLCVLCGGMGLTMGLAIAKAVLP